MMSAALGTAAAGDPLALPVLPAGTCSVLLLVLLVTLGLLLWQALRRCAL
jgi:hypothetical protein